MKLAVFCAILILAGCSVQPPTETAAWVGKYKNACLPEAISMAQGLRKSGVQARVVRIETPKWGHAICTYLYPSGRNVLWGWDSTWKSLRVRAWTDDPASIARAWLASTHPGTPLCNAQFLDQ